MSQTILLIDDEQHIVDVVVYLLEERGYLVRVALDGHHGMHLFEAEPPDLVLLDLTLPGLGGMELFQRMKKRRSEIPIIMLTARAEELDRVRGLEMGADDYVTKPFSTRELAARVKVVLNRTKGPKTDPAVLREGPFELHVESYRLRYFGSRVELTRSEFELMLALVQSPARVFVRDELIRKMYEDGHPVTDRTVDAYIKRIRKKLQEVQPGSNPIQTVYGVGYKLNQDLDEESA